jgi:hypothetical protein
VVVDASASPQHESSQDITRISATQLKKVVRRQNPVYLIHLSQIGVGPDPTKGSQLSSAWEYLLDEFQMYFPSTDQAYPRTFGYYGNRTGGRGQASGETRI